MIKNTETLPLEQAMSGILALLAAEREERVNLDKDLAKEPRKTEVILADSGMSPTQIATVLGKRVNWFHRQSFVRARKSRKAMQMTKSNTKANTSESAGALDNNSVLLAILTLMVDERERAVKLDPGMNKTEVLLDSIGLSYSQIAKVLGKNTAAVRMMITRSRAKTKKSVNSSDRGN